MDYITLIGLIAGALVTISLFPQVTRILKLKETRDISLLWCITLFTGISLWLVYGFLIWNIPLIIANFICSILTFIILCLKIKFG